jgi:hypothetical protein
VLSTEKGIVTSERCDPGRVPRNPYRGYRFPEEIISQCVWLYFNFAVSLREVELMMAYRGIQLSYETIRRWCDTFGPSYAAKLKRKRPKLGDKIGVEFNSFLGLRQRLLISARRLVCHPGQYLMRRCITRIGLHPCLTGLLCLRQVSRHESLVSGSDPEILPVGGAIPQVPSSAYAFGCQIRFIEIGIYTT